MVVIDTSVIIKFFFPEDGSEKACELLRNEVVSAPDMLIYEFTNYLSRRKLASESELSVTLQDLYALKIEFFVLPESGFQKILLLSHRYGLSSYDASFVALAQILNTTLVTADQKLAEKVSDLNIVKML